MTSPSTADRERIEALQASLREAPAWAASRRRRLQAALHDLHCPDDPGESRAHPVCGLVPESRGEREGGLPPSAVLPGNLALALSDGQGRLLWSDPEFERLARLKEGLERLEHPFGSATLVVLRAHPRLFRSLELLQVGKRCQALIDQLEADSNARGFLLQLELASLYSRYAGSGGCAADLQDLPPLLKRFRAQGMRIAAQLRPWPFSVPPPVAEAVLGVLQEALQNCHKHAPGSPVRLRLRRHPRGIALFLRDWGPGLASPGPARGSPRLGLRSIRWRLQALGGEARLRTHARGGCHLQVWVPIP